MSDHFAFRFHEPDNDIQGSLVIFYYSRVSLDGIAKALKHDLFENLVAKNVYLLSCSENLISKQECHADSTFVNEFDAYVGDISTRLYCISFDRTGVMRFCNQSNVPDKLSQAIQHCGMIELFKRHQGLIESSHGYHFEKSSGDHCDKFIRASNLLVSSVEVSFLAIRLLPYLRSDLKRIYVDTSSISFLASIAIQSFGNFDEGLPSIISFESYAVFKKPFDFVEDRSSLVLISATTSGSLAKKLSKHFGKDQIVTLFHTNLRAGQTGLFDVSQAGAAELISRKSSECDFCKQDWKLISIAGEQFLLENPKQEELVIKKDHFDKSRRDFFRQFAARNVLHWNKAVGPAANEKEHFYIDAEQALKLSSKAFTDSLQKSLRRFVSRDVQTVVVFEDAGSRTLGERVREYLAKDAGSVKWMPPGKLNESTLKGTGSVLVLVGAITSGRSLQAVSRKLRVIDPLATITYLVAFSKLPNVDVFNQLKNDLNLGGHEVVVLNHCAVPRVKENTKTAWDFELEKLREIVDSLGDEQVLPAKLQERLQQRKKNSGDPQSLFLPDSYGQPLKLRPTFAFWADLEFDDTRRDSATQADVYWTIQSVLHDLRNPSQKKGLNSIYHTTLLSPANFDRFNDGVVQACLLRAALPIELNYRVNSECSKKVADVISSVLRNWNNSQGEAALEFLMALWTDRLSLKEKHLQECLKLKAKDMTEEMKFILDRLSERIEGI